MTAIRRTLAFGLSAAILLSQASSARAQSAPAAELSSDEAFDRGRELFHAQRYEEALAMLQQSLAREASPNTLLFIGRTERALGRHPQAYRSLARAASMATERAITEPRYAPTAEAARAEAQDLATQLAFVTIHVTDATPGTEVRLNDQILEASEWDQRTPLEPGALDVTARAPDRQPFHTELQVVANQATRLDITLAPGTGIVAPISVPPIAVPPPTIVPVERPRTPVGRTIGFIAMGVGGATSLFGIVAEVLAENTYASLTHDCGAGRCLSTVPNVQPRIDAGHTWQTTTIVAWSGGSALFLAGMILAIASHPAEPMQGSRGHSLHFALDPRGGIAVTGTF